MNLRDQLQSAFGNAYTLERELSGGGMSRVFVAEETALGRKVVIKVLASELGAGVSADRFAREVRLAASLQYPQIVPVLSVGEAAGTSYYVMPLVEGESLRARLTRERALPTSQAINILRDVAKALEFAHAHGIIHRDIKPDNILITGSSAVVADFGIAKALSASRTEGEQGTRAAPTLTQVGSSLGTPAYMSPEQAAGDTAGHRADLYSWGIVAYEMLAGEHPFADKKTTQQLLAAHISERPQAFGERCPECPVALESLVMSCLEKAPEARPRDATEVLAMLEAISTGERAQSVPPAALGARLRAWTRGPRAVAAAAVLLVTAAGIAMAIHRSRVTWVRTEALPQIQKLANSARFEEAFRIVQRALAVLSTDSAVAAAARSVSQRFALTSVPAGARVSRQPYSSPDSAWEHLGTTPLDSTTIPAGWSRLKVEKEGFVPYFLVASAAPPQGIRLSPADSDGAAAEMITVSGGRVGLTGSMPGLGHLPPRTVASYEIGRFEVTNREFKRFVDAGGYQRRELWDSDIRRAGKSLRWEDAIASFVDKTGRPGPATWEVGDVPEGQRDYPVTGVSWYEASAYARFAGAKLPTVYHFVRAATTGNGAAIIPLSNTDGKGLAPVGQFHGMSAFGAFDVAGNAREWIQNADGSDRLILGGAWNDPAYMFYLAYHVGPFDRSPTNGFRLARYKDDSSTVLEAAVEEHLRNFSAERPVTNELFAVYRRSYDYDRTPLDARIEHVDTTDNWIRQRVTFAAAYGGERVIAYMYLPRAGRPPYQTVVNYPGAGTIGNTANAPAGPVGGPFLPKSGRAAFFPIYKSTFERRDALAAGNWYPNASSFYREHVIMWAKDLRRAVDYLYTRPDVDTTRLAYAGVSWGGYQSGIMLAVEPRLKAAVLQCPGLAFERPQPEVDQVNFLPRIKIPVLMVDGRYDAIFPLESSSQPMFRLLGTGVEHKKQVLVNSGHCPPNDVFVTEALAWLDKYLGPVR